MTSRRRFHLRPDRFPDGWLFVPARWCPDLPSAGLRAMVNRAVVRSTFPPDRFARLDWAGLADDEQWAAATTRWTKLLCGFAEVRPDAPEPGRFRRCFPSGYLLRPLTDDPAAPPRRWWACGHPVCPFCHGRRAARAFRALFAAWNRRPPGRPVYAGLVAGDGARTAVDRVVRKGRVAAAAGLRYPAGDDVWMFRAVALTDDRRRLPGSAAVVHSPGRLATLVARWLAYPRRWSSRTRPLGALFRAAETVAAQRAGAKANYLVALGACRADYTPGKGLLDYAGFEPQG